ncbi:response regulator transcription factor [Gudongella sp. SC589]|jgi:DNA-binding NarL/FixJ family response regulator|uniref:response regulator transcription factor n=1 Tax=Gudongella sp. SC589 TaxID=3385990 RepID=UPI003904CCCC
MTEKRINVMLVDDHEIVRYGLRVLIDKNKDLRVCCEAGNIQEAVKRLEEIEPNVILLDVKLPDGKGTEACREFKRIYPDVKVIMLTAYTDDSIISDSIMAGAEGYLLKNIDGNRILTAIRDVSEGKSILDEEVVGSIMHIVRNPLEHKVELKPQEKQILELISLGKTNREIGKTLFISERTVRNNVTRIFKKIDVSNRTEAAIYWSSRSQEVSENK